MKRTVPVAGAVLVLVPLIALALHVSPFGDAPQPGAGPEGGGAGAAAAAPSTGTRPVVSPQARALLARAAAAGGRTTYHGVQYVSAWTPAGAISRVVDVRHSPAAGTGTGASEFVPDGAVGLLSEHYSLAVVGSAAVAGRPVSVVSARDPGAPAAAADAARFWVDRATGLVLRREVYAADGSPTRAGAFVELTVDPVPAARGDGTPAAMASPQTSAGAPAYRAISGQDLPAMTRQGWACPWWLPGPLTLVDARRSDDGIVHLSYGDGLSTVSVFQQRGRLADTLPGHRRARVGGHPAWVGDGVPQRVTWASGGIVFTVVADAPPRTVSRLVAALPHAPADAGGGNGDGAVGRVGRGLDRVASWFNPFG